jgi:hypothetical protein
MNTPENTDRDSVDVHRLVRVAELIGSIFYYGDFKAETHNEKELEKELRALGYFFESEDELMAKLYPDANVKVQLRD